MPKFISEIRKVAGMVRDLLKRDIPKNRYYSAENINLTPNQSNTIGGATAMLGSTFAVELGEINIASDNDDYMAWRIPVDLSAAGIAHDFDFDNTALAFTITTAGVTPALRYSAFVTALEAATVTINGDVYISATPAAEVVYIGFKTQGGAHELKMEIANNPVDTVIIKEFIGVSGNGFFRPLRSIYINKNLYILSTNEVVFRIGVAQKNYTTGSWTYTVLLETNQLTYANDAIIDLDGEIDFGERVSLYWTGEGYVPRVFYIKEQSTWVANSGIQYYDSTTLNTNAYFNYNTLTSESTLQVFENFARVSDITVNNTGGALKSGNWQYYIRQKTGESSSGTGIGSKLVPIFSFSNSNTRLYGSVDGDITSKSVTLEIEGLNALIYDKFELIAVNNTAGVFTAFIAGEYVITGDEMTIIHTGVSDVASFPLTDLVTNQIVVKSAKNLVIARNRLFLSNIQREEDPDLAEAFKTITLETTTEQVPCIGDAYDTVNEYMVPENVFYWAGYMFNETYRIGGLTFLTSGRVLPTYFIADYKIGSTGVTSFSLGDIGAGYVTSYGIEATIDTSLFPDIDGVPFNQAVRAISLVRQNCIPEVLATGYIMPQTSQNEDYFSVGGYVYEFGQSFDPDSTERARLGFLSPDISFGVSSLISIADGYTIYNYGQPEVYNTESTVDSQPTIINYYNLNEFGCNVSTFQANLNPSGVSQRVPFNSQGTVPINTLRLSTEVTEEYVSGVNQGMIAAELATGSANPITVNEDVGFYYAQIFNQMTGKYGQEGAGQYISTGSFIEFNEDPTFTYTSQVWGGDTFTQKTILKALNQQRFASQYTITSGLITSLAIDFYVYANLNDGSKLTTHIKTIPALNSEGATINWNLLLGYVPSPVVGYTLHFFTGGLWYYVDIPSTTTDEYVLDLSDFVVSVAPPAAKEWEMRSGISFYSQNRANTQMRTFNPSLISDDNLNYPYTTTSIEDWLTPELSEGELNYSLSYSALTPATASFAGFNPQDLQDTNETNLVIYSELKLTNGLADPYRIFKPLNSKYYPAKYGSISNTFLKDMNYLVIFMDDIVLFQSLDQQAVQQTTDGTSLIIGDGSVLGAREQPISNIGSPFKTFALNYKDSRGVNHMSWFNPYLKKWMRWTGSIDDLGEQTLNQSFLTDNTNLLFEERSVRLGHDFSNNELFLTASAEISGSVEYNSGNTYSQGDVVYVFTNSLLEQKRYFEALIPVPVNKNPTIPINQVNYWRPHRQSNFTLAYNETAKVMSDFKWFVPSMYLPFNDTFLTHAINTDTGESGIYEHNSGLELYDTTDIDSSVTIVFNDIEDFFKIYRTVYNDINKQPYFMIVRCGDFVTYATEDQMSLQRPHWAINLRNDATISASNLTGSNSIDTAQMGGSTCEVTIFFRNDTERTVMAEIIMKFIPRPQFYSR